MRRLVWGVILILGLSGCSSVGEVMQVPLRWVGLGGDGGSALDVATMERHIRSLAADEFGGRAPGSTGERLTLDYISEEFAALGLEPVDGSYLQAVPLAGIRGRADLGLEVGEQSLEVQLKRDAMLISQRLDPLVRVRRAPLVFAGYGVQAPEHDWDDFAGLDVRGKTLIVLVNDPPVARSGASGQLDPDWFRGRAMTYYGRWTYKFEKASELGAAAVLIVHDTEAAGYPWEVVANSWHGELFTLDRPDGNRNRVAAEGWITTDLARRLFAAAGMDFAQLKQAAARPGFRPVALPGHASLQVRNTVRRLESANVVGRVRGTRQPDEHIVYTAHWDHLGQDPELSGDNIYNGARDNASGVAGLLALAAEFASSPPERSVVFLATTAEEQGLLGAEYYVKHLLWPVDQALANINMDALNVWGPTADLTIIGTGQNSLEQRLAGLARTAGRRLEPEAHPERGYYFRSDHFVFARAGVPALYTQAGRDFTGPGAAQAAQAQQRYGQRQYHKVSDEWNANWDLSGAVADLQLLEQLGRAVANAEQWPQWSADSEFARKPKTRHP